MERTAVDFGPRTAAARLVVLPGLGGSGETHWQTLWEHVHPDAARFEPSSVDAPDLEYWIAAVDRAVERGSDRPILVAHSLGTIAAAAWMATRPMRARAALLVAPPDAGRPGAPPAITGFARAQRVRARIPVTVVASEDDPYGSLGHAADVADGLGAPLVVAGACGHLNADSGLGTWREGLEALEGLARASAHGGPAAG